MSEPTQAIWKALADPTRRGLLDALRGGPRTTGALSDLFPISRIAVMRHLRVLAEAGLLTSRKRGRERWHYIHLVPLVQALRAWSQPLEESMAGGRLNLKDVVEGVADGAIDFTTEVTIESDPSTVFAAITETPGAWWGPPYVTPEATGLRMEPRLGGSFEESWEDGAQVLATITAWAPARLLRLTGPFHLGHALAQVDLELAPQADVTTVALSFRAFGLVDEAMRERFEDGWRELIEVRLKAFVEEGKRLGIDPEPQGNS